MASKKGSYETKIKISGDLDHSFTSSVSKAEKELKKLYLDAKKQGSFLSGVDSLGALSDNTLRLVAKSAAAASAGIAGIGTASVIAGTSFEKQMSSVQAISGASAAEMERLNQLAKEMGRNTQFSATEAGQGLEYMAMAGWNVDQMAAGLPAVLNLAAASGEDLGMVSDIVTDALTAFGLAAEDAAMFSDVLAEASNASNTDVAMMGETFQYVAPVAGALKFSIQDVAIATGLMANAGIKGGQAGTALRATLSRLVKPTKEVRGAMETLGLSVTDTDGNMKSLREIMQEMRVGFAGLDTAQQASVAAALAGQEAMSGLLAIVNASPTDFDKLADAIDHSAGSAEKMAAVRIDNLAGDFTLLKSAAEGAGIETYESISDVLRELVQGSTDLVNGFTESGVLDDLAEKIPTVRRIARGFGEDISNAMEPIQDAGEWFLENPDVVAGGISGIGSAMLTFKAAQGITGAVKVLGSLSGMIGAWPVAAAGLAIGGITGISVAVKTAQSNMRRANLAEHFGDITLSISELDETAKLIMDNQYLQKATEALEGLDEVRSLAQGFNDAQESLDKLNWKIGMGMGLDADELESYTSAVDQMIQGAIDVVEQAQYTAHLNVQAVFGRESAAGNEILGGFDEMYTGISGEVSRLGQQLGEVYSEALEDGIIDVDEAKTIQELQQKLAEITEQVSRSQYDARLERISDQYSGKELDGDTFQNLQQEINGVLEERRRALAESTEAIYAGLNLQLERGELSPAEYARRKASTREEYQLQDMSSVLQGASFTAESIKDAYEQEIAAVAPAIQETLRSAMASAMQNGVQGEEPLIDWTAEQFGSWLDMSGFDMTSRENIQKLWEAIEPQFEELAAYKSRMEEAGKELPEAFLQGFQETAEIGAIAGDTNAMYELLSGMGEDDAYAQVMDEYAEMGGEIPQKLGAGIAENTGAVDEAVSELKGYTQEQLDQEFNNLIVNGHVQMNLSSRIISSINPGHGAGIKPERHAKGGLIMQPTLSWFAEESPEMAIPIDGSDRALSLWEETGRLLGAYEENNYSKTYDAMIRRTAADSGGSGAGNVAAAPVYQPIMNFYGNTDQEDVEKANQAGFEQFREWYEQLQYEQARTAF